MAMELIAYDWPLRIVAQSHYAAELSPIMLVMTVDRSPSCTMDKLIEKDAS